MEHYREFLDARGQGEQAAASEQWDSDFDLEAVPDIPQADLPPQLPKVPDALSKLNVWWGA